MNGVTIKKVDGSIESVNVVRYFKLNDFSYLIFSLNEIDDGGYVKLYVSKVTNGVGETIHDDVEWNLIKDTIKDIIKRNKEGIPVGLNDLDENNLANITINDQKVFKLNASLLQLLSANKNATSEIPNNTVIEDSKKNDNEFINNSIEQTIPDLNSTENLIPSYTNDSDVAEVPNNNVELEKTITNEIPKGIYYGEDDKKTDNISSLDDNYKKLYEMELKKNDELLQELKKYQDLINDLKEVLK